MSHKPIDYLKDYEEALKDFEIKNLKDYEEHKRGLKALEQYRDTEGGLSDDDLDFFRNKIRDFEAKLENPHPKRSKVCCSPLK